MTLTTNKATYKNNNAHDLFEDMTNEEINIFEESYNEWLREVEEQDAIEEQMEEENRLYDYWKENIKGRTPEMLDIGNEICMMGYDIYHTLPAEEKVGYVFDKKYDDIYINAYWEKNPLWSIDYLKDCYELANHWSFYSDWHKDVYGFRPRSL